MIRTDRAVEVLRNAGTDKDPDWSVGSGYLIGGRLVLTAAHNVGAGECLVRMVNGSEHPAVIRRRGEEIRLDLAVLELTGKDAPDVGEGVRYAMVSQEQAERLERCTGLGFPRFKEDTTRPRLRSGKALRNIEQLDGEIPTAGGALASLLTFRVTARPREYPLPSGVEEFGGSPWQGVSGTVIFARDESFGERVVGVVTEHHLAEGSSALTLVPIGAIGVPGVLPAEERRAWWDLLGVPDPAALPELPALSSRRRPEPPAPPRGAVARAELAAATLAALRDGPTPLVTLTGGPGFGKSILARLVAAAADVPAGSGAGDGGERWCPGGVVWLDVGQYPDLSGLLAERLTDLTGQPAGGRHVEQLATDLGAELAARRCLLVLDDVWPSRTGRDDVVGLLLSRMDSVPRLVTTRSPVLLDAEPGAQRIDVAEMEPSEAAALLTNALPGQATENDTAQLGEFARRLGRWPLLLGLAAARLRQWVSDGVPLDDAMRELTDRYAAKGVTAFDPRYADQLEASDPAQRDRAVAAAVEASLGLLTPEDQARYQELAVFPPGQPIPVDVIAGLWAPGLDRYSTDDLLYMLADLSLLSADWRTRLVRLHDLLRDYLVPADPQQRTARHRQLLQGWGDPLLLQDNYRIRWYAYHLDTAGDSDRLYALITPAWRDRVLAITGALSDIAADVLRAAEHAARQHDLAEELQCRLISTILAARAQALPLPLLTALARVGRLDRALGYASLLPPGGRGEALADIATALATTDPSQALDIADRIEEPFSKAEALAKIAAPLAGTDPERALMTVDRVDDPAAKGHAIARIAALLAGTDPERALAAADRIEEPFFKAEALANIATALAGADPGRARRVATQALAAADRIDDPGDKARTLADIAAALAATDPGRADRLTAQAFAAADCIDDPDERAYVLIWIPARLASTDPERALAAVDRIDELRDKARALARLIAPLAGIDPDQALAAADRIDHPGDKARALADIAAALAATDPGRARRLTDQALTVVDLPFSGSGIENPDDPMGKGRVLAGIAAALSGTDPDRALAAADRIDHPGDKARALADIAAALAATDPGRARRLIDHALAAADRIDISPWRTALADFAVVLAGTDPDRALAVADRDPERKAWAVARIAVALAGTDPDRALAVADRIDNDWQKADTLEEIAATLAGSDPDRALAVADRIDDGWRKVRMLANIASVLADTDPGRARRVASQALAVADRIDDDSGKAQALAEIAAALAGSDPDRALAVADRIDLERNAWAVARVAAALAGADPDRALAVVDRIEDPEPKARALARISTVLANTNPGRAHRVASQALAVADRIDDDSGKAQALAEIAAALAGSDPDQALAVADRITGRMEKTRALAAIPAPLADTDPDQALAVDDRIDDDSGKAQALADIAAALAGADPERALAVADRIDYPWEKVKALAKVADVWTGMAYTLDAAADRQTARLTEGLMTRLRFFDAATGNEAWWKLAQFLVTRAQSAPERNEIVQAVLAADEW